MTKEQATQIKDKFQELADMLKEHKAGALICIGLPHDPDENKPDELTVEMGVFFGDGRHNGTQAGALLGKAMRTLPELRDEVYSAMLTAAL